MLERIKVAVDRETQVVLDRIVEGIEGRLSDGSQHLAEELRDLMREAAAARPEWAEALRVSLLSSLDAGSDAWKLDAGELKAAGKGLESQLEVILASFSALTGEVRDFKTGALSAWEENRAASQEMRQLVEELVSDLGRSRDLSAARLGDLHSAATEQQESMARLIAKLKEQSEQMQELRRSLARVERPWWKKIFGG